jgi:uncharacterized phage protein (TIGR01671 family)
MREIKFRCFNTETKKMLSSEKLRNHGVFALADGLSSKKFLVLPCVDKNSNVYNEFKLMQYTGHCDMDGVEIYEGDIVRYDLKNFQIVFDEIMCSIVLAYKNYNIHCNADCCVLMNSAVVGNIYENKELLDDNINRIMD